MQKIDNKKEFEGEAVRIPYFIHEFFHKKINEKHYKLFCAHKEIANKYAGYFLMTQHSALFSFSEYSDCLMNILREIKSNIIGEKEQVEFFEDVYAFLKKDKKQQRKEICKLYEKYKRWWQYVLPENIDAEAIKVSIAYLFAMLGVEMPEPEKEFTHFNGKVYVDLTKIDAPSIEELIEHFGFIPTDFSSPTVIADYYERFTNKISSLKYERKKGIFGRLRKHKCETIKVRNNRLSILLHI